MTHAEVLALNDDGHALRLKMRLNRIGHLRRELLLDLQALSEGVDDPGQLLDLDLTLDDGARVRVTAKIVRVQHPHGGKVGGVGAAPKDAPRENLTTDPYYTRGLRTVLFFDSEPTSLTAIEILPWRTGGQGFVDQATEKPPP